MTDEVENIILHQLREIRTELSQMRADRKASDLRLQRVERRIGENDEAARNALGWSSFAMMNQESASERIDEIEDLANALTDRVRALENAK